MLALKPPFSFLYSFRVILSIPMAPNALLYNQMSSVFLVPVQASIGFNIHVSTCLLCFLKLMYQKHYRPKTVKTIQPPASCWGSCLHRLSHFSEPLTSGLKNQSSPFIPQFPLPSHPIHSWVLSMWPPNISQMPHIFSSLLSTSSDSAGMNPASLLSQILHVKIIIFPHYRQGGLFEGHTFSRLHSVPWLFNALKIKTNILNRVDKTLCDLLTSPSSSLFF